MLVCDSFHMPSVQHLRQLEGQIVGLVGIGHLEGMDRRWQQLGGESARKDKFTPSSINGRFCTKKQPRIAILRQRQATQL